MHNEQLIEQHLKKLGYDKRVSKLDNINPIPYLVPKIYHDSDDLRLVVAPPGELMKWGYDLDTLNMQIHLAEFLDKDAKECYVYKYYVLGQSVYYNKFALDAPNLFANKYKLKRIVFSKEINTSRAVVMDGMFENCASLEYLNLTMFDTNAAAGMRRMFYGCESLRCILVDMDRWVIDGICDTTDMFHNCKCYGVTYIPIMKK